jgi:hypothetical protein
LELCDDLRASGRLPVHRRQFEHSRCGHDAEQVSQLGVQLNLQVSDDEGDSFAWNAAATDRTRPGLGLLIATCYSSPSTAIFSARSNGLAGKTRLNVSSRW